MPTMSEAVSSFTVSPETLKYTSLKEKILRWIQENPEDCKKTTFKTLGNLIMIPGYSQKQILINLYDLSRKQMVISKNHGLGNKAPKTIYINYVHKNIPQSIIDSAPSKEVEEARKIVEGEAIKREARQILLKQQAESEKIIEASQPIEISAPEQPKASTVEIPIQKEDLIKGLSLTLNINFNIGK